MITHTNRTRPSATVRAEAAAWVARLHGPHRTPEVEAGFRRWMDEDPERARAVELITDTWEKSARLRRRPFEEVKSWERPGFRMRFSHAAVAVAAIVAVAVIATLFFLQTNRVSTGVGELRTLLLEDGTRVHLNTDTRVIPHYDESFRRIELERGEAFFEVAKNVTRPFIVTAGGHEVRALGTSFVVRRNERNLAVTLVEGKVSVFTHALPAKIPGDLTATPASAGSPDAAPIPLILEPGERVILTMEDRSSAQSAPEEKPVVDRPSIQQVTAWQRGQVSFDETALADAVAEMNRYSNTRLIIEDPGTAAIRISGIFRAGDQENFAAAISRTYRLKTIIREQEIVLSGRIARPE